MLSLLVWLVRVFSSTVLILAGLTLLVFGLADEKSRGILLGCAATFGVVGGFLWPRRKASWRDGPPSEKQISFASDLGIQIPRGVTKGELSDMISQVTGR